MLDRGVRGPKDRHSDLCSIFGTGLRQLAASTRAVANLQDAALIGGRPLRALANSLMAPYPRFCNGLRVGLLQMGEDRAPHLRIN